MAAILYIENTVKSMKQSPETVIVGNTYSDSTLKMTTTKHYTQCAIHADITGIPIIILYTMMNTSDFVKYATWHFELFIIILF